jgi:hypothetical protein
LDKFADWLYISLNPNITLKNIEANLDKPWNWSCLSLNPNLFALDLKVIREHFAAKLIQRKWRNAISNPNYAICKKRLLKEYKEFEFIYI